MKTAKKIIAIILALIMNLACFSLISSAEGTDTEDYLTEVPDGYVGIYTKDDLDNIKLDMNGKYILMNDIVFEEMDYQKGGNFYNCGKGWEPIGTESTSFTGILDGNGYKIKNLYVNDSTQDYTGLFGCAWSATIKNVTLENANITGQDYVGGIVGCSYDDSTVSFCNIQGTVSGNQYVGGVVGYQYAHYSSSKNYNYIEYCNNSAIIKAKSDVGGIAGYSQSNYHYSYSYYYGYTYYYGFSYISCCSNSGSVTATSSNAGGIVGQTVGSNAPQNTKNCFNSGNIRALSYAGGIVGCCDSGLIHVKHCYSVGKVTATSNFGGCFGIPNCSSEYCYYLDDSVSNQMSINGKSDAQLREQTTFEQWDFNNVWTMAGREDYPYPELIDVPYNIPEDSASVHEHFFTSEITKNATTRETGIKTYTCLCGHSYTEIIAKIPSHITEVPEGYIGIYTKDDLNKIKLNMSGKYILMKDIIFDDNDYVEGGSFYNNGKGWEPIGTESCIFTGVFDGNGYKIENIFINDVTQSYIGLFGYINSATIKNITLENAEITGAGYVGGIAGCSYNNSTISYCNVQGKVSGNQYVGGVVGYQYAFHSSPARYNYIEYCNNSATINARNDAGGIVGRSQSRYYQGSAYEGYIDYYGFSRINYCSNSGSVIVTKSNAGGIAGFSSGCYTYFNSSDITNCYNSGYVSASSYAGGIIGYCGVPVVSQCYSVGNVIAVSNFGGCFGSSPIIDTFCYYLCETAENSTCKAGTAKSEDQMIKQTTYEQWDFDNVWTMAGREEYPYPELVDVPFVLPADYSHEHDYTSKITTPSTHLTEGVETFICVICGDSYTKLISKLEGHAYEIVATTPTCTEQGYTTYTCECGDSYVGDYVDALGHTPASAVEENYVAPTCTENGSKDVVVYCSACDEELSRETVVIDAIGHVDNDDDGYCDMDNEVLDPIVECECNCHKSGISKFFFNFILFFQRLFGSNKECVCGITHY